MFEFVLGGIVIPAAVFGLAWVVEWVELRWHQ